MDSCPSAILKCGWRWGMPCRSPSPITHVGLWLGSLLACLFIHAYCMRDCVTVRLRINGIWRDVLCWGALINGGYEKIYCVTLALLTCACCRKTAAFLLWGSNSSIYCNCFAVKGWHWLGPTVCISVYVYIFTGLHDYNNFRFLNPYYIYRVDQH